MTLPHLTPRETEVLEVLADDPSPTKVLADRLGISLFTFNDYTKVIYHKLGVHSRADAVARIAEIRKVGAG